MPTDELRVCVIGTGRAGMIHARNYATAVPEARLVAGCDLDGDALGRACSELQIERRFTDYREAVQESDIDAVIVAAPTIYHHEIVVAAAQARKHVFCEKPMAVNVTECREMIEAAKAAGVKLQIGFMRRFDEGFRYARDRIEDGEIGEVVLVRSLTHGPTVPQEWMLDVRKSNGPLAEVGSHDIDTLRWYTGSEFAQVFAYAGNYRCVDQRGAYPDFYDNIVMIARFENGMQGCIEGAVSVGYGYDARVEILGTDGIIFVGSVQGTTVVHANRTGLLSSPAAKSWRNLFVQAYRNEALSFVRAVVEDREPEVTGHDGLMAVKVVNAGNESVRIGSPVSIEPEKREQST
jgi:predicted dehydrogenase